MTKTQLSLLATLCGALFFAGTGRADAPKAEPRTITRAELEEKVRGGWAGQMIGVSIGTPTEFRSNGKRIEEPLAWDTRMMQVAWKQDDLYVDMTLAGVLDKIGLDATSEQVGEAFKDTKYHLWHANASARRLLNNGLKPPATGNPKYNIHANDIDFQIESDFIGMMTPGLPREANKYCDRVGHVMNYGDGVYGGMFISGMYAAAFFEKDTKKIVEAGLACIPEKSTYAEAIRDTLDGFSKHPDDWTKTWQIITDKWDKDDDCSDGALRPFNIDARLNGAFVAIGILYGGGDFKKTIEISTRCGQDSDCNPSSAAGIVGVLLGYSGLPKDWTAEIDKKPEEKFQHTDFTFDGIVKSTLNRAYKVIEGAGGVVTESKITIPAQEPQPPAELEQWDMGIPDKMIVAYDKQWLFKGGWKQRINSHHQFIGVSVQGAGNEALLKFTGSAIAVIGYGSVNGGRADVFIDDEKAGELDQYTDDATHDNDLFHAYGLDPAKEHTLRIVTRDDGNEKAKEKAVLIEGAIIYRDK